MLVAREPSDTPSSLCRAVPTRGPVHMLALAVILAVAFFLYGDVGTVGAVASASGVKHRINLGSTGARSGGGVPRKLGDFGWFGGGAAAGVGATAVNPPAPLPLPVTVQVGKEEVEEVVNEEAEEVKEEAATAAQKQTAATLFAVEAAEKRVLAAEAAEAQAAAALAAAAGTVPSQQIEVVAAASAAMEEQTAASADVAAEEVAAAGCEGGYGPWGKCPCGRDAVEKRTFAVTRPAVGAYTRPR